jgi:hypothetical protein
MTHPAPSTASGSTHTYREALSSWVPDDLEVRVATQRRHGQWYALAVDYNIVGQGETKRTAIEQLFGLLAMYWAVHFKRGTAFEDTRRPTRRRTKLAIALGTVLSTLARRAPESVPRENLYQPPPDALTHAA